MAIPIINEDPRKVTITYKSARLMRDLLAEHFGVKFRPETYSMLTSGIYIPIWTFNQHIWDGAEARWYFFYRFANGFPDLNVAKATALFAAEGAKHLSMKINSWKR